jgi:hypothetical protein
MIIFFYELLSNSVQKMPVFIKVIRKKSDNYIITDGPGEKDSPVVYDEYILPLRVRIIEHYEKGSSR